MAAEKIYKIAVLAGDGIGPEVVAETIKMLDELFKYFPGTTLEYVHKRCGAVCYKETGKDLPDDTLEACKECDAILFGSAGLPSIRYEDGTEIAPQLTLRVVLDLYAGIRPIKLYPGVQPILAKGQPIDYVILRENTEGLYWSRGKGTFDEQTKTFTDKMIVTEKGTKRIVRYAFELAKKRNGLKKVTCVDKANVLRSLAYWRKNYDEVATEFPDIKKDYAYIDAFTLYQVTKPENFDVVVSENMFGDIISDLAAGTIGGMGLAPSGDVGDKYGMFQPSHGTAPDIAGKGVANPIGQMMSAGMMLDWLADRHDDSTLKRCASLIDQAICDVLANPKNHGFDLGGRANTKMVTTAVLDAINRVCAPPAKAQVASKALRGVTIGTGFFSDIQMADWKRVAGAEIVAVCDVDKSKGEAFAAKHCIPKTYTDAAEMIAAEKPDFVDIVTRPSSHLKLTTLAAEQGVHILCQKPMAATMEEAEQMLEVTKKNNVKLMINENWRWRVWYREIKALMDKGVIGDPYYARWESKKGDGRSDKPYTDQPYFKDMPKFLLYESGIHFIDTARYLFGEIKDIQSVHKKINPKIKGEDLTVTTLTMDNDVSVFIDLHRCADPQEPTTKGKKAVTFGIFVVEGKKGRIELGVDGRIKVSVHDKPYYYHNYVIPQKGAYPGDSTFGTQQHFVSCLSSGQEFETSGEKYMKSFKAVFDAYDGAGTV